MSKTLSKVTINLSVPVELNEQRKKHKVTWKDLILTGLLSLESKNTKVYDPAIEKEIKQAVQHLSTVWNIIKPKKETPP